MIILADESGLTPEEIMAAILGEITASRVKYGGKSDTTLMSRAKDALTKKGRGDGTDIARGRTMCGATFTSSSVNGTLMPRA
jgi:hypothetical protein